MAGRRRSSSGASIGNREGSRDQEKQPRSRHPHRPPPLAGSCPAQRDCERRTARLQEAVCRDGAGDVRTDIHEDVAYAEREAAPPLGIPLCGTPAGQRDTMIETWLKEHGVFKAHGEACGDIGAWDETICLVMAMAHAYLNAHPAVAMTSDGRLGWTKVAKRRGEADDDEVVALSGGLDQARALDAVHGTEVWQRTRRVAIVEGKPEEPLPT